VAVDLAAVTADERDLLWRLMQLYLHDLSEFQREPLNASGEFSYPYFEHYFDPSLDVLDRGRWAFFLHVNGELAGFAMVRLMQNGRYEMAEFFILRGARRGGSGMAAATAALQRFPGSWALTVHPKNTGAQEFWRRVIAANGRGEWTEKSSPLLVWHQFEI
jgi:predicted acetyltransferase